jgi:hypothetical protein
MILFHLVWVRPGDVRDGLAPTQVFNAIPSSAFSAPAELASRFIDIARKSLAPPFSCPFVRFRLRHPRRQELPSKPDSGRLNLPWSLLLSRT